MKVCGDIRRRCHPERRVCHSERSACHPERSEGSFSFVTLSAHTSFRALLRDCSRTLPGLYP
jgi:hypothetical protein